VFNHWDGDDVVTCFSTMFNTIQQEQAVILIDSVAT